MDKELSLADIRPRCSERFERRAAQGWTGLQSESYNCVGSLPPLLDFGLDKDQHFKQALRASQGPTPLESRAPVDADVGLQQV